ncbi:hypothetical protein [Paludisphaera sp.]|uniref:hypothetical protein n=1 Tax=Paludisphaera sp. TaxID=2017432 RepID=UPI00301BDCF8
MKPLASLARVGPAGWPLALTAAVLAGLLVGIEPVGGDPDRMYRPIKAELARTMAEGASPFWSDRLGLGYPFAAESHAAAFYPPNQLLYRALPVPIAYRLSMLAHYLLMAGGTFAYGRSLGLSPPGAGLAALSFTFCGFQSIHSSHEWAYHALAYLPLCLLAAGRIMAGGGLGWVAALGLAFGVQLTVGHFQAQSWTAGLVVASASWMVVESPRLARRLPLVLLGLAWGGAIAAIQLGPAWELARFVGHDDRPFLELAFYGFPPAHWAELVVPGWLRGIPGGPEAGYWYSQGTTGYEACLYVGTIPLILAFVGLLSKPDAGSRFWIAVALATFLLAILPAVSLPAFRWVTSIPGLGLFRAPGRFLAVTSLGLALLAGKGLDRARGRPLAWVALGLAIAFAAGGMAWAASWSWRPDHVRELGGDRLLIRLGVAASVWLASVVLAAAWLRGRLPAAVLLAATACELGVLYYTSTTDWGWAAAVPESSPILLKLAEEPDVGKVAGMLSDIPLRFGAAVSFPYTGFPPLPPNDRLERLNGREAGMRLAYGQSGDDRRRFGVTHGVWDVPIDAPGAVLVAEGPDPTLDRIASRPPGSPPRSRWRLYRFAEVGPSATVSPSAETGGAVVRSGVLSWDGRTAVVEHDGPCRLVVNRTYYPGWTYRAELDGATAATGAVANAGGRQAADLPGAGTHRVTFTYRPTNLTTFAGLSAGGTALALGALGWAGWRRRSPSAEQDA